MGGRSPLTIISGTGEAQGKPTSAGIDMQWFFQDGDAQSVATHLGLAAPAGDASATVYRNGDIPGLLTFLDQDALPADLQGLQPAEITVQTSSQDGHPITIVSLGFSRDFGSASLAVTKRDEFKAWSAKQEQQVTAKLSIKAPGSGCAEAKDVLIIKATQTPGAQCVALSPVIDLKQADGEGWFTPNSQPSTLQFHYVIQNPKSVERIEEALKQLTVEPLPADASVEFDSVDGWEYLPQLGLDDIRGPHGYNGGAPNLPAGTTARVYVTHLDSGGIQFGVDLINPPLWGNWPPEGNTNDDWMQEATDRVDAIRKDILNSTDFVWTLRLPVTFDDGCNGVVDGPLQIIAPRNTGYDLLD